MTREGKMEKWRKSIKGERTGIKTSKREVVEDEVKKKRENGKEKKKREIKWKESCGLKRNVEGEEGRRERNGKEMQKRVTG